MVAADNDRRRDFAVPDHLVEGKAEPVIIGLPFSLISEAKLVAGVDGFFDRINLNSVTLGVGGASKHISGSLGFNYQFGSSEQRLVADIAGTELTRTKVKISNIGIIYSVSYVF